MVSHIHIHFFVSSITSMFIDWYPLTISDKKRRNHDANYCKKCYYIFLGLIQFIYMIRINFIHVKYPRYFEVYFITK